MYAKCISGNAFVANLERRVIDNRTKNEPIPVCYNRVIDGLDRRFEGWLIFCHEDFEFQENISVKLEAFDRFALHGVVGSVRRGFAGFGRQTVYGSMTERKRAGGMDEWRPGAPIEKAVEVETFDCCCIIVHSSLVRKHGLRFDENLSFDLYVEDFCAAAKIKHKITSLVHPVKCCHHSGSRPTERLYRNLPYLKSKYPRNCFVGSCVYFGTPTWQKRLQDWLLALRRPEVDTAS
jgi:hypothetical protein